jgi:hypothetical protein
LFLKVILYFLQTFHLLFEINIYCILNIDSDVGNSFVRNVSSIKIISNTAILMVLSHTDIPVSCCDTHRSHKLHTFVVTYFAIYFISCCTAHKKVQQCRMLGLLHKTELDRFSRNLQKCFKVNMMIQIATICSEERQTDSSWTKSKLRYSTVPMKSSHCFSARMVLSQFIPKSIFI